MEEKETKWQRVGRARKIHGPGKGKKLIENMPKVEVLNPLELDETIFSAFADITEQGGRRDNGGNSQKSKIKKKTPKSEKPKILSFGEALKKVSCDQLMTVFEDRQIRFKDMPLLWLEDVEKDLESQLGPTEKASNPTLSGSPTHGYPVSAASAGLVSALTKIYHTFPAKPLGKFYVGLLEQATQNEGSDSYVWRIFLQVLMQCNPQLVTQCKKEVSDIMQKHCRDSKTFLTVLWAIAQASTGNPCPALQVWLTSVLPFAFNKNVSSQAKAYIFLQLKRLVKMAGEGENGCSDLLSEKELSEFQKKAFLHNPVQLQDIYFQLKSLIFDHLPSNQFRRFFPELFSHLGTPGNYTEELLGCLMHCLAEDKYCFEVWMQMHANRINQSRVLLQHVRNHWEHLRGQLPRMQLKSAIAHFVEMNETEHTLSSEDEDNCMFLHNDLSKRSFESRSMALLNIFFILTTIALITLTFLDVYLSPSLSESITYSLFETFLSWQWFILEKSAPSFRWLFLQLSLAWETILPVFHSVLNQLGIFLKPGWSWLSDTSSELALQLYEAVKSSLL